MKTISEKINKKLEEKVIKGKERIDKVYASVMHEEGDIKLTPAYTKEHRIHIQFQK